MIESRNVAVIKKVNPVDQLVGPGYQFDHDKKLTEKSLSSLKLPVNSKIVKNRIALIL